jgi:CHAD domain-containing protein
VAQEITEQANGSPAEEKRPPKLTIALEADVKAAAAHAMNDGIVAIRFHEEAALRGEVEPLHQMRVSSRRLRAAVEVFAGVLHGSRVNAYRRDLRWLGQVAGAVRDCDMTAELIKHQSEAIGPLMAPALESIYAWLSSMREEARKELAKMTRSRRYRILAERLANPLTRWAVPAKAVVEYAPLMIGPLAKKVRKAGKSIDADAPADAFHKLRKRIKRLRYAFEMLSAGGGPHHRHAIERLEEMQELLGQHHDAVALGEWLRQLANQPETLPGTAMMAAGAMVQELAYREGKLKEACLKRWKQFRRDQVIDEALEEISDEAKRRARARLAALASEPGGDAATTVDGSPASGVTSPNPEEIRRTEQPA